MRPAFGWLLHYLPRAKYGYWVSCSRTIRLLGNGVRGLVLGFMLFDNAEDNDIQGNVKGNAISEEVVPFF